MPTAVKAILLRLALGLALLALAHGTYRFRRHFVKQFFHDAKERQGPPALPRVSPEAPATARAGMSAADRVRVVLLDGIGHAIASNMEHYDALCRQGLDLTVDVGFPTVSLPIQHALWTGLTQQQSGILFRIKPLPQPPAASIPAQVADSRSLAEYHQYIAASFGFHSALPPGTTKADIPDDWKQRFRAAAIDAVTGPARLVFVHVLRADSAGHKHGPESVEYRDAVLWSDEFLAELRAAEQAAGRPAAQPAGPGEPATRWFLLSDHGHRPGGGHGGGESSIRLVRACIFGDLGGFRTGDSEPPGRLIHLVDFSRAIADSLGVTPSPASAGRPLAEALAATHDPDSSLPWPGAGRWTLAMLAVFLALLATAWAAGDRLLQLPWWLPVAVASVFWLEAMPSLSTPMIYRGDGRIMYHAASPGLLLLVLATANALRQRAAHRVAVAQLALPLALALACLTLAGGAHLLLGAAGDPPLMPGFTAFTSLTATLLFSGAAVVALVVLASCVPFAIGRWRRSDTADRAA